MAIRTRAAIATGFNQPLSIEMVEASDPGPGQVLVRILAAGVCHTDESVRSGAYPAPLPMVLGHEGAGIVEAVGQGVTNLKVGDKCIATSMQVCGACPACYDHQPEVCDNRAPILAATPAFRMGDQAVPGFAGCGTFSELMTVRHESCVKVETDLPFEILALIGCGVLTGVGTVLNAGQVRPGQTVAVVGCGGVGLSMVQGARIASAGRIIAIDPTPMKREAALALGATDVVDPGLADPVAQVKELTGGRGVDYGFEAVGLGKTITQAWRMTRRGGTCVAVGVGGTDPITIMPNEFIGGVRNFRSSLLGAGFPQAELPRMVKFVERGQLRLNTMVTKRLPLEGVNEAFDLMAQGQSLRSVLLFD